MVLKTIVLSGAVLTAVIGGAAAPAYADSQPSSNSNFGNVFDRDSGNFIDRGNVTAVTNGGFRPVPGAIASSIRFE
ncbi:hypothetical protein GCM10023196_067070 [Actinoallomurus vinaceus]|uniref:Uncharacterized protein n=1 Tax=Actinoallomurus vinaceus TaxID=1080074 RepID=A0ABP8UL85_9ACTN